MGKFQVPMTSGPDLSSTPANRVDERDVYPLSKVARAVEKMLEDRTRGRLFWVRAEISEFNINKGHAYLSLVEAMEGNTVARIQGRIWASRLSSIRKQLGQEFDEVLKPGREIVFSAHMAFHAVYGFSLNIQEIDLDVLLGEMERRRKATLEALTKEGAVGRNAQLSLSPVPQRLLLIGSAGTAGFTDFMTHLQNNAWGYVQDIGIIDATVQGTQAPAALVKALHRAGRVALKTDVDAVVMLRGGGAKLDLDAFNDLSLCRTIASMEVPVIVGIGHETDQTLVDVVAHTACKTPTAVADFILERTAVFEESMAVEARAIAQLARTHIADDKGLLGRMATFIRERPLTFVRTERGALHTGANGVVRRSRSLLAERLAQLGNVKSLLASGSSAIVPVRYDRLRDAEEQIMREATRQLRQHEERMGSIKGTLAMLGPEPTLKRGFSVTRKDGKAIRNAGELTVGDQVETQFAEGTVSSTVTEIKKNDETNQP